MVELGLSAVAPWAVLIVISLFVALSVLLAVSALSNRNGQSAPGGLESLGNKIVFLFDGSDLVDATGAAMMFINAPMERAKIWQALSTKLGGLSPALTAKLNQLMINAKPFVERIESPSDVVVVSGRKEAGLLRIAIDEQAATLETVTLEKAVVDAQASELAILREITDNSPVLAWRTDWENAIVWANRPYLDMFKRTDPSFVPHNWPLPPLFSENSSEAARKKGRLPLKVLGQDRPQWFETSKMQTVDGGALNFAIQADPLVRAEESLRNFVQTLTQTFAHLSIGLAIFDRNRQLALFNPALIDLTLLNPQWLSGRPSLTSFLDLLRENRRIPEPKNYKTWRDRIEDLEKAALDGTFEESWPLPDGRTFKVIGRPHPEGAVAFLFEDITASIGLQRRFRSELELGQSVIDSMEDAIAVFTPDGYLAISNQAFANLWQVDPGTMVSRMTLNEAIDLWRQHSIDQSVWASIAAYEPARARNAAKRYPFTLTSGQYLTLNISALPGGGVLYAFRAAPTVSHQEARLHLVPS